jgi:hypothetical protein
MALSKFATGRAGGASVEVVGLFEFLRRASAADSMFNQEIRSASIVLAKVIVTEVRAHASYAPYRRQAIQSAMGLRAFSDRVPAIKLRGSSEFVSKSRPSKKRKRPVTRGDVFYGAEFGSDRLRQFPDRSPKLGNGNQGYFFWPTVEAMAPKINQEYLKSLDRLTKKLERM